MGQAADQGPTMATVPAVCYDGYPFLIGRSAESSSGGVTARNPYPHPSLAGKCSRTLTRARAGNDPACGFVPPGRATRTSRHRLALYPLANGRATLQASAP